MQTPGDGTSMPDATRSPDEVPVGAPSGMGPRVVTFPGVANAPGEGLPPNNLPLQLSSFVGREREISELRKLLLDNRLLTLTGPGGSGKTRLALEVAKALVEAFEDGVWLVELASLSDPDLVAQTVASALGVREQPNRTLVETLTDALGEKETLLILDNCEHLVEACARLTETLLRACPKLRILATSRESLGVAGEVSWPVPSLSLPNSHHLRSIEELSGYEAVRLFVERASAVFPGFALTGRSAQAVVEVCHKLEGMPLAIELAAARIRVLSVPQISTRLAESFRLLTTDSHTAVPRQRTLRATIGWSYELLGQEEQTLFQRLSVFAGGFTLEAAESVCSGEGIERDEVLALLSHLVEKSLVVKTEWEGEARYRLLETIRQYGQEKLLESEAVQVVKRRHATFFLALAEEIEPRINGADRRVWLERLEIEHDNLRAALLSAGEEAGLRLTGALWWFWLHSGHVGEGRRWLEGLLEQAGPSVRTAALAKALCGAGWLAYAQGDLATARPRLEQSVAVYRETDDRRGLAYALGFLPVVLAYQGDFAPADAAAEESVRLFREVGDRWGLAIALTDRGVVAEARADYDLANGFFEESAAILRELGDRWALSLPLRHLGIVASRQGDYVRAEALYKDSLVQCRQVGEKWLISLCLEELAGVAGAQGVYARAARLWGAEETLRERLGASVRALYRADYEHGVQAAKRELGEKAFAAAWAEGRAMTLEEAVSYALQEVKGRTLPPAPRNPAGLTDREVEVLRLVARGLTDAQVAEELFLSRRTVNAHLRAIYGKLEVNSRAAATRFAIEHELT